MSETFTFDVHYSTSFEALEKLRDKMLQFLKEERRDYHPVFDVNIIGKYLLLSKINHVFYGYANIRFP